MSTFRPNIRDGYSISSSTSRTDIRQYPVQPNWETGFFHRVHVLYNADSCFSHKKYTFIQKVWHWVQSRFYIFDFYNRDLPTITTNFFSKLSEIYFFFVIVHYIRKRKMWIAKKSIKMMIILFSWIFFLNIDKFKWKLIEKNIYIRNVSWLPGSKILRKTGNMCATCIRSWPEVVWGLK